MNVAIDNQAPLLSARPTQDLPGEMLNLSAELVAAAEAAKLAGALIRESYGRVEACSEKKLRDIVTEVDLRSNELVCGYLRRLFPAYGLISEESPPQPSAQDGRTWLIDPLDGTAAFYYEAGRHIPSVMIALLEAGEARASVVYFPMSDELFYAEKGRGAFKNGECLSVSGESRELASGRVAMNHYSNSAYDTPEFVELHRRLRSADGAGLVTIEAPHSGMACRLLEKGSLLLAVVHDNNPRSPKQEPWDVKPVQLIVEEAGGFYGNLKGERYDTATPELIVIARSREIAEKISLLAGSTADAASGAVTRTSRVMEQK